jgi:hypothetical protein
MIDSMRLLIPKKDMSYRSGISGWDLYSQTEFYSKYVRNPSKVEKETGKYFPRLTGYKRMFGQDANIKIEFSIPKLLYLNNLDEVEDKDFDEVVNVLIARLDTMGIFVSRSVLETASVSSVDFSRNILIEGGYTVNYLISELNKVNLRKSFDFTRSRYINDGQSLYAHTKSHQFVIYDKMADLRKSKSRAIDKDESYVQKNIFDEMTQEEQTEEVIRFEVRLSQKQKMNKVFKDLGYRENPTFKDVFDSEMSQKIIYSYWEKLILERNLSLFSLSFGSKETLQRILLEDKNLKPKQAIYFLGLIVLARDENGIRQLRAILSKRCKDRTWYRMVKDLECANQIVAKSGLRDWVLGISNSLNHYTAYKTKERLNRV